VATPLFIVDAFTDEPFRGNPAAVCLLDAARATAWMQRLAGEMNLSETAFVWPDQGGWRLRWFTPRVEVDLCGHATLATAHVLWQTARAGDGMIEFLTRSGKLSIRQTADGIEMDFPAVRGIPCDDPGDLCAALGVVGRAIAGNNMDYLVEVQGESIVRDCLPDFARLAALPVRGVMVTSRSDSPGYDFVSRFFAPRVGVPEDPVTGSAHCCLGPYWAERLGRNDLVGYQASARGGVVRVGVRGDRVLLGGRAVTVISGYLEREG
jgi:predicted PhzF superfamily epimerase YddE/YHI9